MQWEQLQNLKANFGLSDSDIDSCLIFGRDQDPWIPPGLLISIARHTGKFSDIASNFETHVPQLNQLVYKGTVTDLEGRTITRTGVSTIGERSGDRELDPHKLAEGRAIGAALRAQGFDPFKSNFVEPASSAATAFRRRLIETEREIQNIEDESARRKKDLARIHALAVEKGLIGTLPSGGKFTAPYRDWLSTNFQCRSAVMLDEMERKQVINALENYDATDFLMNIPQELHSDALIA
jgi:hypothetical protein